MIAIRFPCGGSYELGDARATYRLAATSRKVFECAGVRAEYGHELAPSGWRITLGDHVIYLRADTANSRYVGGSWPDGVPTGYVLRRDGEDYVLAIHDATGTPGEFSIPALDGQ